MNRSAPRAPTGCTPGWSRSRCSRSYARTARAASALEDDCAVRPVELLPRHRASAGLSAVHADRPPLHLPAVRLGRLSRAPRERAVRRALRRARPGCARAAWSRGGCRRTWPRSARPVAGVLVAVDHRRGLYPQYLLLCPGLSRAARLARSAQAPNAEARRSAVDGARLRPEPEQPLAAHAAGRAGVRGAAVAAARGARSGVLAACPGWCSLGLLPYGWMVCRSWKRRCRSASTVRSRRCPRSGFSSAAPATPASTTSAVRGLARPHQVLPLFRRPARCCSSPCSARCSPRPASRCSGAVLGRRVAAFLTVAFLMPSAVLLLLLGFDYSTMSKHVFHVYPLPAYAIAALWMGLGFAWLTAALRAARARHAGAAARAGARLALILARARAPTCFDRATIGARAMRSTLLAHLAAERGGASAQGEADLGPIAYFHMIENVRPDITLYQPKGLVLGNRLFHPAAHRREEPPAHRRRDDRAARPRRWYSRWTRTTAYAQRRSMALHPGRQVVDRSRRR